MSAVHSEPPPGTDPGGRHAPEVARVLLVSEHAVWAGGMRTDLAAEGFRVVFDPDGESAFHQERIAPMDAAVVDLRGAAYSGIAVCGALRARSALPVLAVVDRADEPGVLAAYAAGADQHVTVDTSARLVVARLRALLRRVPRARVALEPLPTTGLVIDAATSTVVVAGTPVILSRREMEVLSALLTRPGRVVSRSELVGSWPSLGPDRRLDFVIRRLRQKLEAVDGQRRIDAVRGVGFRFEHEGPVELEPMG